MAVNFPDNPSNGDTTTVNGVTYTYNATKNLWKAGSSSSGGGGGGTTAYATAAGLPQTATNGDLALVEETDKLYIWNDTAWYNIALINTAPSITQGGAGSYNLATDGTPTVITLTATDPESLPVTWSYAVTSGSLTNGGGTTATVTQADNVFTITPTTTEAYAGEFTLTFSVTDGANIVNDVNSFTLNFVTIVNDSAGTVLLLKTDAAGTDNQIDASSNSHAITENGSVTSTAFSPYHPKGYSVRFTGSDHIQLPSSSAFGFGTGDFTIECWVYFGTTPSTGNIYSARQSGNGVTFRVENDMSIGAFYDGTGSGAFTTGANSISLHTWHFISLVRTSSGATIYIDGVSSGTSSAWANVNFPNINPIIGRRRDSGQEFFNGIIKDLRVTKGGAITSPDNPTEPLTTSVSSGSVSLLLCHKPYIADDSTNDHTITISSSAISTIAFTPFDHLPYTKSDYGGSAYFPNASGTYMDLDINAIGTSDYTIEGWIYLENLSTAELVFDTRPTATDNTTGFYGLVDGGGNFQVGSNNVTFITSSNQLVMNTWNHFAIVRNGSAMTLYINGTNVGTGTQSQDLTSTDMRIGTNRSAASVYRGYIADLRLVTGTQVYTSDFIPPTEPLTAISGTEVLTCTNTHNIWDAATGSALTLVGNTTASTTQTKYASSSIFLDGTGDYAKINIPAMETAPLGTRDWTMELWFNTAGTNASYLHFFTLGDSFAAGNGLVLDSYQGVLRIWNGADRSFGTTPTFSADTWHHIAVVSEGGDLHCYFDGTEVGSGILSQNFSATNSYPEIWLGAYSNAGYGTPYSSIATATYFEDVRFTLDLARYTANFTPPTGSLEG